MLVNVLHKHSSGWCCSKGTPERTMQIFCCLQIPQATVCCRDSTLTPCAQTSKDLALAAEFHRNSSLRSFSSGSVNLSTIFLRRVCSGPMTLHRPPAWPPSSSERAILCLVRQEKDMWPRFQLGVKEKGNCLKHALLNGDIQQTCSPHRRHTAHCCLPYRRYLWV